jgi:hypothetical protein
VEAWHLIVFVVVMGLLVWSYYKFFSGSTLTADLVFMDMHSIPKGEFATIAEIREESSTRNFWKIKESLDLLCKLGRVIKRERPDGQLEYRIHDDFWKEPSKVTQEFN